MLQQAVDLDSLSSLSSQSRISDLQSLPATIWSTKQAHKPNFCGQGWEVWGLCCIFSQELRHTMFCFFLTLGALVGGGPRHLNFLMSLNKNSPNTAALRAFMGSEHEEVPGTTALTPLFVTSRHLQSPYSRKPGSSILRNQNYRC